VTGARVIDRALYADRGTWSG